METKSENAKTLRLRVWFEDGSCSELINPNKPKLLTVFEAEHGRDTPETVAETMWLLWHALGRPGGDFDAWNDTVEELERVEWELGKAYK